MPRRLTLFAVLIAAATLTVSAFYNRTGDAAPDVSTAAVSRGSIVREISATGTLEAVTTVQVGSQSVTFEVDAHPGDIFTGVVKQVRLNPVVTSNVVTYAAIITAPNPERKLLPGMTARLTVETARTDDVLRVPAAALRLRPTPEQLEALNGSAEDAAPGRTRLWLLDESGLRGRSWRRRRGGKGVPA